MWLMLQQTKPDDFVLATGESHTVRDFVERAFAHVGIQIEWHGNGLDEKAIHTKTGKTLVEIDPQFFRPKEVNYLLGDAAKAKDILGWKPRVYFDDLVSDMMNADRGLIYTGEEWWRKTG